MVKGKQRRVGPQFDNLLDELRGKLEPMFDERLSDRQLTDDIARFMRDENLDQVILRRAEMRKRQRGRGGLFF